MDTVQYFTTENGGVSACVIIMKKKRKSITARRIDCSMKGAGITVETLNSKPKISYDLYKRLNSVAFDVAAREMKRRKKRLPKEFAVYSYVTPEPESEIYLSVSAFKRVGLFRRHYELIGYNGSKRVTFTDDNAMLHENYMRMVYFNREDYIQDDEE